MHAARFAETHFDLGRVNIDVDSRGVEFEEQHIGRMAVAVQDIGVGLPDGVR